MKYNSYQELVKAMEEYESRKRIDEDDIPDSDDFDNCDDIDEEPDYDHDKEEMIEERGIEADPYRM